MKKKLLALSLAAVLVFALCACHVSSSSTSTTTISTSVTDADGNTKENTITNEVGVSVGTDGVQVTNKTTREESGDVAAETTGTMADLFPPIEKWYDYFAEGLEGESDDGENVYLAVDDPSAVGYAMLLFQQSDGSVSVRNGEVSWDEEQEIFELYDEDVNVYIPFKLTDANEESCTMTFVADGASLTMYYVDQDTIIQDIHGILSNATSSSAATEESAS